MTSRILTCALRRVRPRQMNIARRGQRALLPMVYSTNMPTRTNHIISNMHPRRTFSSEENTEDSTNTKAEQETMLKLQAVVKADDMKTAIAMIHDIFNQSEASYNLQGWACGLIYYTPGLREEVGEYIAEYARKFPNSRWPARVFIAERLAAMKQYDGATELTRNYLRDLKDTDALKAHPLPVLQHGMTIAFLVMTSAYTDVGARSYSLRILDYALNVCCTNKDMNHVLIEEQETIQKELKDTEAYVILDAQWEAFFETGEHGIVLGNLCEEKKYMNLAKRVDLIESQFRFGGKQIPFVHEFLLLAVPVKSEQAPKADLSGAGVADQWEQQKEAENHLTLA